MAKLSALPLARPPAAGAPSASQAEVAVSAVVPALAGAPVAGPTASAALLDASLIPHETARAARELLEQGESAHTRATYASALRYWRAWHQARFGMSLEAAGLPVAPEPVLQFIVDHAARLGDDGQELLHELPPEVDRHLIELGVKRQSAPMSLSTLESRMAALARLHRDQRLASPTDHPDIKRLLRAVRQAYARRGELAQGKDPLDKVRLEQLLATCDGSPKGIRDRALLCFAFASGGRRRSEIAGATLANLRARSDGAYSYALLFSKTNREGRRLDGNDKPIAGAAAQALRAWLELLKSAGPPGGTALFRRINRGGRISLEGLSEEAVWEIVRSRCLQAGLEGDFSPHSLRSGFLTEAGRRGVPLREAMSMSGHVDPKTAMGYMRVGELLNTEAANLLGDD